MSGDIGLTDVTEKFMVRLNAVEQSQKYWSITGNAFKFAICSSQISLLSDQIDALQTVVGNIEDSFLDPTGHLTPDIIEIDDIQDNLDAKNMILKYSGQKVACTSSEAYQEG